MSDNKNQYCPSCKSILIQPLEWAQYDERSWIVYLYCPECFHRWEKQMEDGELSFFSEQIETGLAMIKDLLETMEGERWREEVKAFVSALWTDNIVPMDF